MHLNQSPLGAALALDVSCCRLLIRHVIAIVFVDVALSSSPSMTITELRSSCRCRLDFLESWTSATIIINICTPSQFSTPHVECGQYRTNQDLAWLRQGQWVDFQFNEGWVCRSYCEGFVAFLFKSPFRKNESERFHEKNKFYKSRKFRLAAFTPRHLVRP